MDNIVVAFANEEAQRRITRLLESDGVSPAGCFFSGADAIRAIRLISSVTANAIQEGKQGADAAEAEAEAADEKAPVEG